MLPAMMGVAQADDIKVATAGPITGPYAAIGEQMKRGAELAVKDINAKGGVLGKQLALTVGDDACDPKQARTSPTSWPTRASSFVDGHYLLGLVDPGLGGLCR